MHIDLDEHNRQNKTPLYSTCICKPVICFIKKPTAYSVPSSSVYSERGLAPKFCQPSFELRRISCIRLKRTHIKNRQSKLAYPFKLHSPRTWHDGSSQNIAYISWYRNLAACCGFLAAQILTASIPPHRPLHRQLSMCLTAKQSMDCIFFYSQAIYSSHIMCHIGSY